MGSPRLTMSILATTITTVMIAKCDHDGDDWYDGVAVVAVFIVVIMVRIVVAMAYLFVFSIVCGACDNNHIG